MTNKIKALLVEDHAITRMVGKSLLQDFGLEVATAESGEQALEMTLNNRYDVVFMDIGLGQGMDGFETTVQIKAQSALNKDTPIFALTAHSSQDYQDKAKETGMAGFLTKPLDLQKLAEIKDQFSTQEH